MKSMILAIMLSSSFLILCKQLDFIDSSMDEFIKRVVPSNDSNAFKAYYKEFIESLEKLTSAKKMAEFQELRKLGRCGLAVKYPAWERELKEYPFYEKEIQLGKKNELKSIRLFLTRYGVYEKYREKLALEKAGIWNRVKSYSYHVKSKCASWIGSFRSTKQVT
jgi:hypothetical protein